MMAEVDIVNGCKQNRRGAQRALYEGYAARLMAIAVRYMGNRDDAQDVLQEALVRAFERIGQFDWQGDGSLGAWLSRIVVNAAVSQLRKRRYLADAVPLDAVADEVEEPTTQQVTDIDTATILDMVASLPAGYRTIFNMYCIDGYSHREIAQRLGINEGTSSSQLSRARAMLARMVKDYINQHANS